MSNEVKNPGSHTLIEAISQSLMQVARYNPGDEVAPAAVLWTDADGQWQPVISQLRGILPELLTLGEYEPEEKTGPAIWLRCVIERALPELKLPDDAVPIIYMPNVSRQTLRAAGECPDKLKPLIELQFRGKVWTQRNGRDWTVEAFLVSADTGLGLDVAGDQQTHRSMLGALERLAVTPISSLRDKRLEAEDFDRLMIEDTPRDLLLWLSDPSGARENWDDSKWSAFCSRCKAEYGFDPEGDGEIVGGEKLGVREHAWLAVWQRFAESPALYPGIPDLLRRSKPSTLIFDKEPWPDENEEAEKSLRGELLKLGSLSRQDAREEIERLEKEHGMRREWVWARLGHSPLADALEHLAALAIRTAHGLGGDALQAMADVYVEDEYLVDDAALKAIGMVKSAEDARAVENSLRSIYLPWLDDAARHFQKLVAGQPLSANTDPRKSCVKADPGQCLLFSDGLRYDLARRLAIMAEERHIRVSRGWTLAALPTVTATSKPAVSPIADQLSGHRPGQDFLPEVKEENQSLTTERFKKLLLSAGYQVLASTETGDPKGEGALAWTEYGEFDSLGHKLQAGLAARINDQLELLLERVERLLDAGWKEVRVITDHGWLLVPGGLPAVKLPKYLTESRWTRCAAIREGSHVDVPVAAWHWNPDEHFAFGPGVHCFIKGNEYAHGGLSLQECVIPELTFASDRAELPVSVAVTDVQWLGMRCRIVIEPAAAGITADIRTKPNDPESSIATPKHFDDEGRVGILVGDDSMEGATVSIVLLDSSGRVIGKKPTTVGGD